MTDGRLENHRFSSLFSCSALGNLRLASPAKGRDETKGPCFHWRIGLVRGAVAGRTLAAGVVHDVILGKEQFADGNDLVPILEQGLNDAG